MSIALIMIGFPNFAKAEIKTIPPYVSAPLVLYDEGGNVLDDGFYDITITLTDSFGVNLYQEEQQVEIVNGVTEINIGDGYEVGSGYAIATGGLRQNVFDINDQVYAEIMVAGQNVIQEIAMFTSQPYAYLCESALSVKNESIDSRSIQDASIVKEDLSDELWSSIESLVSSVTPKTLNVEDSINLTYSDADAIEDVLVDMDQAILNLSGDISINHDDLTALKATFDKVDQDIAQLNTNLSEVETNLSSLSPATLYIRDDIELFFSEEKNLEDIIVDMDQTILDLNGDVSANHDDLNTVKTNLDKVDKSITELNTSLSKIETSVSSDFVGTSDVQSLTNKTIDGNNKISGSAIKLGLVDENYIDANLARDSEVAANYLALTGGTINGSLDLNGHHISDVGYVDGVDVSSLSTNVSSLESSYVSLETRVNTLENDTIEESDVPAPIRPLAYGHFSQSNGCTSGYNIDSSVSTSKRCYFNRDAQGVNYVVLLTPSVSSSAVTCPYHCGVVNKTTQYFDVSCACKNTSASGSYPKEFDVLVFENR